MLQILDMTTLHHIALTFLYMINIKITIKCRIPTKKFKIQHHLPHLSQYTLNFTERPYGHLFWKLE
jgi:hypothetical protein